MVTIGKGVILIIIIGIFIVFSLIGYLVELIKKINKEQKEEEPKIKIVDINIPEKKEYKVEKEIILSKEDSLLDDYNNDYDI